MEIILARHGRSDVSLPLWTWMAPQEIKRYIEAYEEAGILADSIPAATASRACKAAVLVCSTSRRCVQSAQVLSQDGSFLSDALFREAGPPYWTWRFPKLPAVVWGSMLWLAWFCRLPTSAEPLSRAAVRARRAAQTLAELARQRGSVFLMGHGMMNALIARHLVALGWAGGPTRLLKHWESSVYRMPPERSDSAPPPAA